MIEIKNLTKIYSTKTGQPVKAIDDISIKLHSKGLVFITGKSGSGKSTLLNVLGGLDTFDDGDIIVKNKSINDFNISKFDSYRNTEIGFIFQEYNVLTEFSVSKNVSIALELQGTKADEKKVDEILKQVDLEGYGHRMPNELSTGQKQRVAIARALIKSPDVILADEPTGALDSQTSKQIFETLQKLSKDKLVIVITHDQEFAEKYGDRIIELSDGQIIKDHVKKELEFDDTDSIDFKKSSLPLNISVKMGIKNIKRKPYRLFFVIMLSAIAFTLFGLSDTMSNYNKNKTTITSFYESNINHVSFSKYVEYIENGDTHGMFPNIYEDDFNFLREKFTQNTFYPVFKQNNDSIYESLFYLGDSFYYNERINGSIEVNEEMMEDLNLKLVAGRLPIKTNEDNEIAITKFIFSIFEKFEFKDNGNKIVIKDPSDILDKTIYLNDRPFIITGVIDTSFNADRYKKLIDIKENSGYHELNVSILKSELAAIFKYDIHNLIYVREGYYNDIVTNRISFEYTDYNSIKLYLEPQDDMIINTPSIEYKKISKLINNSSEIIWKDDIERSSLKENEIIVPISSIPTHMSIEDLPTLHSLKEQMLNTLVEEFVDSYYEEIKDEFTDDYGSWVSKDAYRIYIFSHSTNEYHEGKDIKYFEGVAIKKILQEYYFSAFNSLVLHSNYEDTTLERTVRVVGFFDDQYNTDIVEDKTLILSDILFKEFTELYDKGFGFVVTSLTNKMEHDIKLIDFSNKMENNVRFPINNEVTVSLQRVDGFLVEFSKLFLYVGIGLVIFASLLLFNFISVSIMSNQKEIGILRALGAKRIDIFKIFITESLIIAFINFIIATIASFVISNYINHIFRNDYKILIKILNFSIRQISLTLIVSIVVAIASTFIPVYKISNKNPVDIIKS